MNFDDLREQQDYSRKQFAQIREQAVQAITEKNRLQKLIAKAEKRRDGSQEAEQALLDLRRQYAEANEQIGRVKAMMRSEEECIRQKTAEAMQRKMEWRRQQLFGQFPGTVNQDGSAFRVMAVFVVTLMLVGIVLSLLSWLR